MFWDNKASHDNVITLDNKISHQVHVSSLLLNCKK